MQHQIQKVNLPKEKKRVETFDSYRLILVSSSVGRNVMLLIFKWGCSKPETMSFKEFLLTDKSMQNITIKKSFTKLQRDKIEIDPSGETFDIPLLYNCIQLGCSNLLPREDLVWVTPSKNRLEYLINTIKNFRNEYAHFDPQTITQKLMFQKVEEMRNVFTQALVLAGSLYNRPQNEIDIHVKDISRMINGIRDTSLSSADCEHYMEEIITKRNCLESIVNVTGKDELKRFYVNDSKVDTVSFLSGNLSLELSSVFTRMEMIYVSKQAFTEEPNHENILEITNSNGNKPPFVLVEGGSGVGKTTLCKLIISSWCKSSDLVHGLDLFDLVFQIECHNSTISSFSDLLLSLLPKTSLCLKKEDLIRSVLSCKVLFVVDGLDEINNSSRNVLDELLNKYFIGNMQNLRILCTTRPGSVGLMYKMVPSGVEICHMKIADIPSDRLVQFITKLDQEMKRTKLIKVNTGSLVNWLQRSTGLLEHSEFTLNMDFLTYLWTVHSDTVNCLTSETSLYLSLLDFTQKKLVERLKHKKDTQNLSVKECYTKFLEALCRESILAVKRESIMLGKESTDHLVEVCRDSNMPPNELFSATVAHCRIQTFASFEETFYFPHKGLQDFYAARYIMKSITNNDEEELIENIMKDIKRILETENLPTEVSTDILQFAENRITRKLCEHKTIYKVIQDLHVEDKESIKLNKYCNVLVHLGGLLGKKGNMMEKYAEELVNLLVKAGVVEPEQWFTVLAEVEYDPVLGKHVGKVITQDLWRVKDKNIQAASVLLKDASVDSILLDIDNDPQNLPNLMELLQQLSQSKCNIQLNFHYHWHHPQLGCSDDFLNHIITHQHQTQLQVKQIMGSVSNISGLFPAVEILYLGLGKDYAQNSIDSLDYLRNTMTKLKFLCATGSETMAIIATGSETMAIIATGSETMTIDATGSETMAIIATGSETMAIIAIRVLLGQKPWPLMPLDLHVQAGLPLEALPQLPNKKMKVDLWFSDVGDTDVEWVGNAALKLQGGKM
ncbi:NACHT, LRR and PYD domains-containing protein 10-like 1 [Homarus americanus]|uniref:NACHT, LRR and PYD domains-containing protein 10-like 1 n=1 Tax=Homarus americanus TaxID=6706 RepID=A0A8J5JIW2_HOMAM|nr:NACHT, LRR and PYD domains-containing protein 10-like 1 [Homarus americanus]